MAPETPHTTISLPLRWRDMDMLGHLNQSVYHEFLEEGRAALLLEVLPERNMYFVLAHVEVDHRHEVRHTDGRVDVVVRVSRVGSKSITLDHEILLPDGSEAATGRSVLVAWDPERRGARALTEQERAALGAG